MSREIDSSLALTEELVRVASSATSCPESVVRQFVEPACRHLLREYGGERLPKLGRKYPVADIRRAIEAGESMRSIKRRFRIGTSTIYRLLDDPI